MAKKSMALIAGVIALALVVASTASAAESTYPAGTRGPVGQTIEGTGKNITLNTAWIGKIGCGTLNLRATLRKNNGTELEAQGENARPTQAGCYLVEPSRPLTVTNFNITKLFFNEPNGPSGATRGGTFSFTWTTDYPSGAQCTYIGTNVPVSFVSTASPAVITSNDPGGHVTSIGGCGNAKFEGSFTLHGPGVTTPVVLH